MTDRELLEMAAKAAGISLRFLSGVTPFCDGPDCVGEWNPLNDDGDALRLAVRLVIDIRPPRTEGDDALATDQADNGSYEPQKRDPYAATRRAIVRAAAEIGKAML